MCLKRLLLLFVLFSFCFCSLGASEVQQGLTNIEDYAINIENNSLQQKKEIESLKIDLEGYKKLWEDSQKQQTQMLQTQEALLKQSKDLEQKCKNWKIVAGVTVSVSIISIGTLILVLNSK